MKFDPRALAILFAADRLEASEFRLERIRQRNPDAIFIFDRGPLDGKVYAAATAPEGEDPVSMMRWMDACDSVFLKKYPVDIGFILGSSIKESNQRMADRIKEKDTFDSDIALQMRVRQLFDELKLDSRWQRIEIADPTGNLERDFATIKAIVRGKLREEEILLEGRGVSRER